MFGEGRRTISFDKGRILFGSRVAETRTKVLQEAEAQGSCKVVAEMIGTFMAEGTRRLGLGRKVVEEGRRSCNRPAGQYF